VQRTLRIFAVVVGVVGLALAVVVLVDDPPGTWYTALGWTAMAALLLASPAVLLLFAAMLGEVLALPGKLRALPDVGPERARQLAGLAREAKGRDQPVRLRTLPRDVWRVGRLALAVRDDIPWFGVVTAVFRVPMLILVTVAIVAGLFQVFVLPWAVLLALWVRPG